MQSEIEAKFLKVNFEELRHRLVELGAECIHPMRLMRRVMLDHPDERYQKKNQSERLRIRDEGDRVTITYKASNTTNYAHEVEIEVDSFDESRKLFQAIGFVEFSFQESKRETWHYKNVEVVLDEWPWVSPYIEIEGKKEADIKSAAQALGFEWNEACFGSVDTAYMADYPKMLKTDSIGEVEDVRFDMPLPKYLAERL